MKYFTLPDGSQVGVPDEWTLERAEQEARKRRPELYVTAREDAKGGGIANLIQGIKEGATDPLISLKGLMGQNIRGDLAEREIAGSAVRTTNIDDVINTFRKPSEEGGGVRAGLGSLGSLVTENLGRSVGYMAPALAAGRVAAMIPGPQQAFIAPVVGGLTLMQAYAASNAARQQQENRERGQPDKELDLAAAQAAALPQAVLDQVALLGTLGVRGIKLATGVSMDAVKKLSAQQVQAQLLKDAAVAATGKGLLRAGAQGAARGVLFEMPTEAAQQVLEMAQAGVPLDSPEALKEAGEAGLIGGLMGGVTGPMGRIADVRHARRTIDAQEKAKSDLEAQAAARTAAEEKARLKAESETPEAIMAAYTRSKQLESEIAQLQKERKQFSKNSVEYAQIGAQLKERIQENIKLVGDLKTKDVAGAREALRAKSMTPEEYFLSQQGITLPDEEPRVPGMNDTPPTQPPQFGSVRDAYLWRKDEKGNPVLNEYEIAHAQGDWKQVNAPDALRWLAERPGEAGPVIRGEEAFPGVDPNDTKTQTWFRKELARMADKKKKEWEEQAAREVVETTKQIQQQQKERGAQSVLETQATLAANFAEQNSPRIVYGKHEDAVMQALSKGRIIRAGARALGLPVTVHDVDVNDIEAAGRVLPAVEERLRVVQEKLLAATDAIDETRYGKPNAQARQQAMIDATRAQAQLNELALLRSTLKKTLSSQEAQDAATFKRQDERAAAFDAQEMAQRQQQARAKTQAEEIKEKRELPEVAYVDNVRAIFDGTTQFEPLTERTRLNKLRKEVVASLAEEIDARRTAAGLPPLTVQQYAPLIKIDGALRSMLTMADRQNKPEVRTTGAQTRAGKLVRSGTETVETKHFPKPAVLRTEKEQQEGRQLEGDSWENAYVAPPGEKKPGTPPKPETPFWGSSWTDYLVNRVAKAKTPAEVSGLVGEAFSDLQGHPGYYSRAKITAQPQTKETRRAWFERMTNGLLNEIEQTKERLATLDVRQRGEMRKGAFELTQPKPRRATTFKAKDLPAREQIIEDIAAAQGMVEMPPGAQSALEAVRRRAVDGQGTPELFDMARETIRELEAGRDPRQRIRELQQRLMLEAQERTRNTPEDATGDLFAPEAMTPTKFGAKPGESSEKFLRGFSPEGRFGKPYPWSSEPAPNLGEAPVRGPRQVDFGTSKTFQTAEDVVQSFPPTVGGDKAKYAGRRTPGAYEKAAAKATMKENVAFRRKLEEAFAPLIEHLQPYRMPTARELAATPAAPTTEDTPAHLRAWRRAQGWVMEGGTAKLSRAARAEQKVGTRLDELRKDIKKASVSRGFINLMSEHINRVFDADPSPDVVGKLSEVIAVLQDTDTTLHPRILQEDLEATTTAKLRPERDTLTPGTLKNADVSAVNPQLVPGGLQQATSTTINPDRINDPELRKAVERLQASTSGIRATAVPGPMVEQTKKVKDRKTGKRVTKTVMVEQLSPQQQKVATTPSGEKIPVTYTNREITPIKGETVAEKEDVLPKDEAAQIRATMDYRTQPEVPKEQRVTPEERFKQLEKRIAELRSLKKRTRAEYNELRDAVKEFNTLRETLNIELAPEGTDEAVTPRMSVRERALVGGDKEKAAALKGVPEDFSPSDRIVGIEAAQLREIGTSFVEGDEDYRNNQFRLQLDDAPDTVMDEADYNTFASTPPSGVTLVWDPSESEALVDAAERAGIDLERVKGVTLPDGSIIVVGSAHSSPLDLEITVAHELGHERTNSYLGKDGFAKLAARTSKLELMGIAKDLGREQAVREAMQRAGEDPVAQKVAALKEIFGVMNEGIPAEKWTDRVRRFIKEWLGAVRQWLRDNGFASLSKLSDADLYYVLRTARDSGVETRPMEGEADFATKRTAEQQAMVELGVGKTPTLKEKMRHSMLGSSFRTHVVDRFDPLMRFVEQLHALGDAGKKAAANQMHYYARMADRVMNVAAAAFSVGVPTLKRIANKDGTYNWKIAGDGTSLADVVKALGKGGDPELFGAYLLAERAQRVGYDVIYGEDTPEIRKQALATIEEAKKHPEWADAKKKYIEYNKGLIEFLQASGYMTEKDAKALISSEDYVPAYRVKDDELEMVYGSGTIKMGNVRYQPELKDLRGDGHKIIPFPTSALLNTRTIVQHALVNLAAKEAAYTLDSLGLGRKPNEAEKAEAKKHGTIKGRNVIHFRQEGAERWFIIDFDSGNKLAGVDTNGISADLLVTGLEGVSVNIPAIVRFMNPFSRALRYSVTRFPAYALRQLARDPAAAYLGTGANFNPILDTLSRVGKVLGKKDATAAKLQREGVVGGLIYEGDNETVNRLLKQFATNDPSTYARVMKAMDDLAVDADTVTRANIYDAAMKDGSSELEALLKSMESMNFNTHGVSRSLYLMNMTVPFLRAQINALDVIYKSWTGRLSMADRLKTRDALLRRGGMLAAVAMMYALAARDEDWYKSATPEERYNYIFIPIPGSDEPLRLPIPFELGLIFKAVPEALVDVMFGDSEASEALKALGNLAGRSVPNPVPQGMKPMIEAYLGSGFFSGRPIEPQRTAGLEKQDRYGDKTPEILKEMGPLAGMLGISPAQMEHLVRGYFSGFGIAMLNVVDAAMGLGPDNAPTAKDSEGKFFGSLFQPVNGQNIINKAYQATEKFAQAAKSYKKAEEEGNRERLMDFINDPEKMVDVAMGDSAQDFRQKMAELQKQERMIRGMSGMTSADKRSAIDGIKQAQQMTAIALMAEAKQARALVGR